MMCELWLVAASPVVVFVVAAAAISFMALTDWSTYRQGVLVGSTYQLLDTTSLSWQCWHSCKEDWLAVRAPALQKTASSPVTLGTYVLYLIYVSNVYLRCL